MLGMKYTFDFKNAEGKGSAEMEAGNDKEFWGDVEAAESSYGYTHIPNSAFCVTETRPVSEPPKTPAKFKTASKAAGFDRNGKPNRTMH